VDNIDAEEKAKQEAEAKAKADAEAKAKKEAEEQAKKEASKEADKGSESESNVQDSTKSDGSGSVESSPEAQAGSDDSALAGLADAIEAYQPDYKVKAKRAPSGVILCVNGHAQGYAKYITIQKIFDEMSKSALSYLKSTGQDQPSVFTLRRAVANQAEKIVEDLKGHVILANSITADTRELCAYLAELDNVQVFIGNAS
jgi:hypothetical protein